MKYSVLLSWLMLAAAQANCTVASSVPLSFGTLPSYAVANSVQSTSTNSAGFQCEGSILNLLNDDDVKVTATSKNNFNLRNEQGENIPFTAAATPDGRVQFTQGKSVKHLSSSTRLLLSNNNAPLYLRTVPGANVSAGAYTDTLTLNWQWSICTEVRGGLCIGRDKGSDTSIVEIALNVTNDCRVAIPEIIFEAAAFPAEFAPVNGNFQISCTKGTQYYVGIDGGNNAAGGRRQMMQSNSAHKLQYDIFNSKTNQLWTDTVSGWVAATGNGSNTPSQSFPFRAAIYKDQPAQPAGIYKDQVRVNIYF
jgi:spore coat protein U-like protein